MKMSGRQTVKAPFWGHWNKLGQLGGMLTLSLCLSSCAGAPSPLQPRGTAAADLARLWWVLLTVATVVYVIVLVLLGYGLFRSRRRTGDGGLGNGRLFVLIGGGVIPALILIGVMVYTVGVQAALATPAQAALTVELIGHQWWWEVYYPDQRFTTANEVHIPVGQPVLFKLTSADVIHSFWAPQLQAKMDMLPGQSNTTWITANRPGVYQVECAEYCGLQHAHMRLLIIAEAPDRVNAWMSNEMQPAAVAAPTLHVTAAGPSVQNAATKKPTAEVPTDPVLVQGQQIFFGSACVYCHTIRGTVATGQVGPDLTHIASRRTIGSGMLENNTANLSGWIINAQAIKPGNQMPPMYLDAASLHALVAYLQTLK
ncbi:MAG: cytochrome c oxidase subunit II [Caldilineaceae bacterium]